MSGKTIYFSLGIILSNILPPPKKNIYICIKIKKNKQGGSYRTLGPLTETPSNYLSHQCMIL